MCLEIPRGLLPPRSADATPVLIRLCAAQLLSGTAANPPRSGARDASGKDILRLGREKKERTVEKEEEGWDLVDNVSV